MAWKVGKGDAVKVGVGREKTVAVVVCVVSNGTAAPRPPIIAIRRATDIVDMTLYRRESVLGSEKRSVLVGV